MNQLFIDSGGWFAHLIAEDADDATARRLFSEARRQPRGLVTTNAVMFETYALLVSRAREGRALALGLPDDIEAGLCHVVRVTRQDERRAVDLLRRHSDKTYSLCDALSFVVMERMGIREAIAFDRHFRQYGVDVLE